MTRSGVMDIGEVVKHPGLIRRRARSLEDGYKRSSTIADADCLKAHPPALSHKLRLP